MFGVVAPVILGGPVVDGIEVIEVFVEAGGPAFLVAHGFVVPADDSGESFEGFVSADADEGAGEFVLGVPVAPDDHEFFEFHVGDEPVVVDDGFGGFGAYPEVWAVVVPAGPLGDVVGDGVAEV